jgi:cellulose synthase/poly-beta-1,6-N-acetylglucosamine synthase-like glycosyltransferase
MTAQTALVLGVLLIVAVAVAARWTAAIRNGRGAARAPVPVAPPPARWPTVSVIVPAWREAGTIERCLATVLDLDYPDWELIVVAGGPDGTFAAAQQALDGVQRATVVPQPGGGKPAALNAGLLLARGEVIVLLDADSLVAPDWLRALVAPIGGDVPASTGNHRPTTSTPVTRAEEMERISAYDVHRRFVLQGAGGIAIARGTVDEIGGFPERAFADDWDLDARLGLRGYRRAYARNAMLLTERPATIREFWHNEIRWRRAHLASVLQWPAYFLGNAVSALRTLYPYVLAWLVTAVTAAAGVVLVLGDAGARGTAVAVWLIVIVGVLVERLALTLEVVACTGDRRWFRDGWAPPVLWMVTLAAAAVATLTVGRATLEFKGPRRLTADDVPARWSRPR